MTVQADGAADAKFSCRHRVRSVIRDGHINMRDATNSHCTFAIHASKLVLKTHISNIIVMKVNLPGRKKDCEDEGGWHQNYENIVFSLQMQLLVTTNSAEELVYSDWHIRTFAALPETQ